MLRAVKEITVGPTSFTKSAYCLAYRADAKSVSTTHLACSLFAPDASGNATAVVPVDQKLKR